jgi:hypothetical protein
LGWFSTAWRTFALAGSGVLVLSFFFTGIVLIGLLD